MANGPTTRMTAMPKEALFGGYHKGVASSDGCTVLCDKGRQVVDIRGEKEGGKVVSHRRQAQ
ncbi:hypothetical protein TYRP_014412 [Tyrophagus putrescentiae]|nr:hypothetical protein TYRP_014412 [Tyrophagus putrescentiae]